MTDIETMKEVISRARAVSYNGHDWSDNMARLQELLMDDEHLGARIERVVEAARKRVMTEYGPCGCGACADLREALGELDE